MPPGQLNSIAARRSLKLGEQNNGQCFGYEFAQGATDYDPGRDKKISAACKS